MDALARLALVGSEWAGFASMVPGRGGATRELAEEAGERLVKPRIIFSGVHLREMGTDVNRFKMVARRAGYDVIPDAEFNPATWWNTVNRPWLDRAIAEKAPFRVYSNPFTGAYTFYQKGMHTFFGQEIEYLLNRGYWFIHRGNQLWLERGSTR